MKTYRHATSGRVVRMDPMLASAFPHVWIETDEEPICDLAEETYDKPDVEGKMTLPAKKAKTRKKV